MIIKTFIVKTSIYEKILEILKCYRTSQSIENDYLRKPTLHAEIFFSYFVNGIFNKQDNHANDRKLIGYLHVQYLIMWFPVIRFQVIGLLVMYTW